MTLARTLLLLAATASVAHAQSAPAAEALFRDGRNLIKAGKLEAGCDKLDASEKLESSVGTLLNLGDCKEKLGRTASAWAAFRKAEAMAKRAGDDKKRQFEAGRRAQKLEGELSNLVVQVGKSTPGIVVKRDGDVLDAAAFNSAVPVDPGSHVIVAEAPGYKAFRTEISLGKGGKRYIVVPSLEQVAAKVVVATPMTPPSVVVRSAPEPVAPRYVMVHETWSGTRKASIVLGLAGAATIGGGIYFGSRASDLSAQADARCPGAICNDTLGLQLNDDAQRNAKTANILFVTGGAAVAVATVMWLVGAPSEHTVIAPTISSDHAGAAVVGRF